MGTIIKEQEIFCSTNRIEEFLKQYKTQLHIKQRHRKLCSGKLVNCQKLLVSN